MLLHRAAAGAGAGLKSRGVEDQDGPSARCKDAPCLQYLDDAAGIAAGDAEHAGELLVGEGNFVAADMLLRRDDPFRCTLLDRMRGVAGRGLQQLRALEQAQQRSASLQDSFARYAACQLAQLLQTAACNAAHSIEQRAAKWIIAAQEHIGGDEIPFTHEQLAGMLGVSRSYASRVIQMLKARRILATRRGAILILDGPALAASACACNHAVRKHFGEVLGAR